MKSGSLAFPVAKSKSQAKYSKMFLCSFGSWSSVALVAFLFTSPTLSFIQNSLINRRSGSFTAVMSGSKFVINDRNIPFSKYHGLGNDFILVDNSFSPEPIFSPKEAIALCDRNFGIGADGVIFSLPGKEGCDYTMRIYNSDGSEPQMCGNGIRCMARFLVDMEKQDMSSEVSYAIWTNAGKIVPKTNKDDTITVDMGTPTLTPEKVPTTLKATKDGAVVNGIIEAAGTTYEVTCVSMGNPHA
eukprot:gene12746-26844_t